MWYYLRTRTACLLSVLCIVGLVRAQEEDEDDGAWKQERKKLQKVIDERIEADVAKAVTKDAIIDHLKWAKPVNPPAKTLEAIIAEVEKRIDGEAAKRFPEAERETFQKEAEEKYRLYKVGEEVEFTIRGGVGTNTKVTGQLFQVTDQRIRVGSRWIVRKDIEDETAARFYPEVSERFVTRHVRVLNIRYDTEIEAFKTQRRRELLPKAFAAAGYIVKPTAGKGSIKPDDWVARSAVVDYLYERQRQAVDKKIRRKITEEVFTANNFVYVAEQNEWMPPKQADSVRERLRRILEEKREREEAAKREKEQEANPWGGEPGMDDPGMMPEEPHP